MFKIAFINTLRVPSGEASVNRTLSLAKGLVEYGDDVSILSSAVSTERASVIDGIKVYNLGKSKSFMGLAKAFFNIYSKIKEEKYDYVTAITSSPVLIFALFFICKIRHIKYIRGVSEFPEVLIKHKKGLGKLYVSFYRRTIYRLFDGMYVMTNPLIDYLQDKIKKNCKILHLPMTVDPCRFDNIQKQRTDYGRYIAYCGNMTGDKDGIENLIHAFGKISHIIPDVSLVLIGGANSPERITELKNLVKSNNYRNIIFHGKVEREYMPQLLKNAEILALARPSNRQALGGFPTKLGEYLSTGNPVVITAVGDIPKYLNDSNSYIVQPDDNDAFSEALLSALTNIEDAKKRGKNGLKLVYQMFDYHVQTKRLHDFLEQF